MTETKNLKTGQCLHILLATIIICAAGNSYSDNCYVWTSQDGVKHFGSIPPPDIAAKTVECKSAPSSGQGAEEGPTEAETLAQQRKARELRESQCASEKQRLNTLKTSGSQIRMKNPDGSIKYLTQAEVNQEVELSESFISQNCK